MTSAKPLRIAYVSMVDPRNRRSWSGTLSAIATALGNECGEVVFIGPLPMRSQRIRRAISLQLERTIGWNPRLDLSEGFMRRLGRIASRRIEASSCDLVVVPTQRWLIGQLRTSLPIVYVSDATPRLLRDYYAEFSSPRLPERRFETLDRAERTAIARAERLIYSSQWAADSAIADYGADPDLIGVFPFGANLDEPPTHGEINADPPSDRCDLLFVGRNWERKGGAIALDTLRALRGWGIAATLTVVGCTPPVPAGEPGLIVIADLDKNNAADERRLHELYRDAHFFILPTRADCTSVALCEASAYGLPALATRTGGTASVVWPEVNGLLFDLNDGGAAYATAIRDLCADKDRYRRLRATSRDRYEQHLNWDRWGESARAVISSLPL